MAKPGLGRTNAMTSPAEILKRKKESGAFDVFLCHNNHDKPQVRQIARDLQNLGILPWLDEWELRPGLPWQDALEQQIDGVQSAAVFVGTEGVGPWQHQELAAFLRKFVQQKSPVIPVLLENAPNEPDLPLFLQGMTWVDFRESDPNPMDMLVWGITGQHGDSEAPYEAPKPAATKARKKRPEPAEDESEPDQPAKQQANANSSWAPPAGLAQTLIGSWNVQIASPYGVVSQMMLQLMPGNMFRGQIPTPLGMGSVEGMWQLTPMNQVTLQGTQTLGFQTMPYYTIIQLTQTGPYQMAGYTNAGEQTSWQKVS